MKSYHTILAIALLMLPLLGSAAERKLPEYDDDLYGSHDKSAIISRKQAEAERFAAQQAQYKASLSQTQSLANGEIEYDFNNVLADTYESAYARRLYGFSSPTYRLPSSYYTYRYSDAFFYASAYDPALYNIMVSGDLVWVEPKYITSMFGSWGAIAVPTYSWYYNWSYPYWSWGYPYNYAWRFHWGMGYYDPFFSWHWGWGYPYYPPHHHHRPPHRPNHPHFPNGGVGNTGHYHIPGGGYGRNPGASAPVNRGGTISRPSTPSNRTGAVTRDNNYSSPRNNSYSSPRSNSGSSYRGSTPSYGGGGSYGGGSSFGGGGGSSHGSAGNPRGR